MRKLLISFSVFLGLSFVLGAADYMLLGRQQQTEPIVSLSRIVYNNDNTTHTLSIDAQTTITETLSVGSLDPPGVVYVNAQNVLATKWDGSTGLYYDDAFNTLYSFSGGSGVAMFGVSVSGIGLYGGSDEYWGATAVGLVNGRGLFSNGVVIRSSITPTGSVDPGPGNIYVYGGGTFIQYLDIPSDAAPVTDAAGEIALDTNITNFMPMIQYYDGANERVIPGVLRANLSTTDNSFLSYDASTDEFLFETISASSVGGLVAKQVLFGGSSGEIAQDSCFGVDSTNNSVWFGSEPSSAFSYLDFFSLYPQGRFRTESSPLVALSIEGAGSSSADIPFMMIGRSRGTLNSQTSVDTNDGLGGLLFYGYETDSNWPSSAIIAEAEDVGTGYVDGALVFGTFTANTLNEKVRIEQSSTRFLASPVSIEEGVSVSGSVQFSDVAGLASMTDGTVTVSTSFVKSTSKIFLAYAPDGIVGVPGDLSVVNLIDSTSFDIVSTSGVLDDSSVSWVIID